MKKIITSFFCLVSICAAATAQIATWNSTTGTSGATGLTTGTATLGAGLTATSVGACGSNVFTTNDIFDTGDPSPTTAADAVADNEYIDFPITADAGYQITITNMQFNGEKSNTGGVNTGLYNSTTDISSGGITWTGTGCAVRTINNTDVVIPPGSTVNFRLYVWGATNSSGSWRVGSVQFFGTVVLPITLTSFDAKPTATTALLTFTTASERDNAYFSIERSNDGAAFTEIGRVSGNGTTYEKQDYTYTDATPSKGINYYRLKQVDFDGAFSYSGVVSVVMGRATTFVVSPSPAADQLKVRFKESTTEAGRYEIYDQTGRLVLTGEVAAESVELNLDVNALTTGIYVIRMTSGRETITEQFRKL